MAATPLTPTPPPAPPWRDVFKDPALIISLVIMFQFYGIIIWFGWRPSQMATEAKQVILQAYVSVFTGAVWYWLGSTNGSKQKDKVIAAERQPPPTTTIVTPVVPVEPPPPLIKP